MEQVQVLPKITERILVTVTSTITAVYEYVIVLRAISGGIEIAQWVATCIQEAVLIHRLGQVGNRGIRADEVA